MIKSLLLVLVSCLISLTTQATERSWLILGDSISAGYGLAANQGWVNLLQSELIADGLTINVVNASISGDTTTGGLQRLPRALEIHQPELVIIELGGNDGLRGQSPKLIRNNLVEMIKLSRQNGAKVLILGMQIPSNYGSAYTKRFAAAFKKASEQTDAALMPFFLADIATDRSMFQADGIHPNNQAQSILLNSLQSHLKPFLK